MLQTRSNFISSSSSSSMRKTRNQRVRSSLGCHCRSLREVRNALAPLLLIASLSARKKFSFCSVFRTNGRDSETCSGKATPRSFCSRLRMPLLPALLSLLDSSCALTSCTRTSASSGERHPRQRQRLQVRSAAPRKSKHGSFKLQLTLEVDVRGPVARHVWCYSLSTSMQ